VITIWWRAGSGKGTVSRMLVDKLGYKYLSVGDMKREIATSMGISIHAFNMLGEDPANVEQFDKQYEDMQKALDPNDPIVLDSRLGFYCQPKAFNVFLDVDTVQAAKRIVAAKRWANESNYTSLQEAIDATQKRNHDDQKRYISLYAIDYFDPGYYDLVIDTTDKTAEEVTTMIVDQYKQYITTIH
jgi:cytidylate kinase